MTEPSPRGAGAEDPSAPRPDLAARPAAAGTQTSQDRFTDLADRPVAEHVEVFEDEHARLQRRLGTIDLI